MQNLSTTSEAPVIHCSNVWVEYEISEYRSQSLKETLVHKWRGKGKTETFQALKGLDLDVKQGECVGLIGHNGCGKSTLLKVMAGILPPSRGEMVRRGSCMPLIELGAGFDPELTGRENIFLNLGILGLSKKDIASLVPYIADFSELGAHLEMPVKTYSSGMYMRLGFACSVCIQAETLLIDEILAVGDENFQRKCLERMREIRAQGTTMVLVSHDLHQIQQMANRVVVIDGGHKIFDGHPKDGIQFYHDLMDQKRLASLPATVRHEELRQKDLKENDTDPHAFGSSLKLLGGRIINQQTGHPLTAGGACAIEIDYQVHESLGFDPCIGFAIHTKSDFRLLGGNTQKVPLARASTSAKPGVYRAVFRMPKLMLAAGMYRLIIAAHNDLLTRTLDLNGCAHEFEVLGSEGRDNFDHDLLDLGAVITEARIDQIPK